jgi:hypothetical protein
MYIWKIIEENNDTNTFNLDLKSIFADHSDEIDIQEPLENEKLDDDVENADAQNEENDDEDSEEDVEGKNIWLQTFKDHFYTNFSSKGKSFFGKDLFEKDLAKELSMSKEVTNSKKMTNYINIYQIEPTIRDHFYNLNFDPPCVGCLEKKLDEKYINNSCLVCIELIRQFESVYVLLYDLIIKYFYLPKIMKENDKEVYYGYYLNEFLKNNQNKVEYFTFQRNIPTQKYEMFTKELLNLEKLELNYLNIKNYNTFHKVEEKDEKDLIQLYKFFVIWNGLFLILFKKYPEFTRRIKEKSQSYELKINYETNELISKKYSSYFSYLFIKMFDLEEEDYVTEKLKVSMTDNKSSIEDKGSKNDNQEKNSRENAFEEKEIHSSRVFDRTDRRVGHKKMDIIKHALKQAAIDKLSIEDKPATTPIDEFFRDPEIHFFDVLEEDIYKKINPPENDIIKKQEYIPDILIKLWNTLRANEKFDIFFGYNPIIKSGKISVQDFLDLEIIKEESLDVGINEIFTSIHRSELLKSLKFPQSFFNLLVNDLKLYIEQNNIVDGNKLTEQKDIKSTVKNFKDLKLNYLKYYNFYTSIFKKYLQKPKQIVSELRKIYSEVFKIFNNINSNLIKKNEAKIAFVNFYKLLLSKNTFSKVYEYFEKNDSLLASSKFDNEKENESNSLTRDALKRYEHNESNKVAFDPSENIKKNQENKLKENRIMNQYEVFIMIFSMGPIEYLVSYVILFY